ncbi:hypothetical protein P3W45_000515 [Vairimorpha bombi]|jgi:hypothetical protein
MFFKKIFSFAPKKEELFYENNKYKMLITTIENKKATKFVYNENIKQYSIVKKIHHDNLINPLKINTKNNTITTQPLYPFEMVYKDSTQEFNKYTFLCLAKAIDFLHKKCKIVHNNIDMYSLFFTEDGKIVLGGFEKSQISESVDSDNIQFSNLLQKYLKKATNLVKFIRENENDKNYFYDNEIFFFGFDAHTLQQKKDFIFEARNMKSEFVEIYKKRLIYIFINDLTKEYDKFYKEDILDMIFYLELENYDEIIPKLFDILDSNVRLYLFRNSKKYISKLKSIETSLESILLGLKIKKNDLRTETINYLKNNIGKCSEQSQVQVLESMYSNITEYDGMILVLKYVNETKPVFQKSEIIYEMCKKYLTIPGCKNETLKTIQIFYPSFNKHKVSTELLPQICTYLADERLQSPTFLLIEDILGDLKCHKEKIISKEWSFDSFRDFFNNKNSVRSKSMENIKKVENEVYDDDEWDDDW